MFQPILRARFWLRFGLLRSLHLWNIWSVCIDWKHRKKYLTRKKTSQRNAHKQNLSAHLSWRIKRVTFGYFSSSPNFVRQVPRSAALHHPLTPRNVKRLIKDGYGIANGVRLVPPINMRYWPSEKSRWLDIGHVLFCVFMDQDEVGVN